MFHHSFEHLPDPIETLERVYRLMPSGGNCLIRIPLVSSEAWKKYGPHWVQLDAPRHFFLYSIESLKLNLKLRKLFMTPMNSNSGEASNI